MSSNLHFVLGQSLAFYFGLVVAIVIDFWLAIVRYFICKDISMLVAFAIAGVIALLCPFCMQYLSLFFLVFARFLFFLRAILAAIFRVFFPIGIGKDFLDFILQLLNILILFDDIGIIPEDFIRLEDWLEGLIEVNDRPDVLFYDLFLDLLFIDSNQLVY